MVRGRAPVAGNVRLFMIAPMKTFPLLCKGLYEPLLEKAWERLHSSTDEITGKYASRGFPIPPGAMYVEIGERYKADIPTRAEIIFDACCQAYKTSTPKPVAEEFSKELLGAITTEQDRILASGEARFNEQYKSEILSEGRRLLRYYSSKAIVFLGESTVEVVPRNEKEKEQKFGLLSSLRQASPDFASYCSGLRAEAVVGVLFLDIDNFKSLNTSFTEAVVDRDVLVPFQKLLGAICAHRGEAYRHGGDEFLVLLPNQTSDEVAQFAERLREQVAAERFSVGDSRVHITVSIGIALWPKDGDTLENLIAMANAAEHEAKAKGKNRIAIHGKVAA